MPVLSGKEQLHTSGLSTATLELMKWLSSMEELEWSPSQAQPLCRNWNCMQQFWVPSCIVRSERPSGLKWPNTADRETKQEPIGSKQMDEADTHCCAAHREVVQEDTTASPVVGEPEIPQEDATPLKEETKKFTQRQQSSS